MNVPPRTRSTRTLRTSAAGAALAVSLAVLAPAGATPAQPPSQPDAATIQPQLQQQLDKAGTADFWVRFDEHADLTQQREIADWDERGADRKSTRLNSSHVKISY